VIARAVRVAGWSGSGRVASATASWTERRGLLLGVFDQEGRLGVGEASPLPGFSPDDLAEAEQVLRGLDLPRVDDALGRLEAAASEGAGSVRAALARSLHDVLGDAAARSPSAAFAVETALADLASQRRGTSIARWLGATSPAPIARTALVGGLDPGTVVRAVAAIERGAAHVKVKARGADLEAEAASLRELSSAVAGRASIRLDLNGAQDGPGAVLATATYRDAGASVVEEPTSGRALLSIGPLALPWLVDESLSDLDLRTRFLAEPACSGLVLKPTLLGGLGVCLDLAERAHAAGKAVVVTHAFEGPVALAAAAQLALACGADLAGLDVHGALGVEWARELDALPERGSPLSVVPSESGGLGLSEAARSRLAALLERAPS
jgi:L-alanine-DL-glutamate epimerase-like enolase superfamily enzyme